MQGSAYRGQNIYEQLEAVLSTLQLGDQASDHRAEVEGFNGWNYVAVTAVARQALRSLVYVYGDKGKESQEIRKSLRLEYGTKWRVAAMADASLRKAIVREHQGEVLQSTHPLVRLLKRPNPYQGGGSFRWEQIQQLRLHGTCLIFERPNVTMQRTVERYVIPMAIVTPVRPGKTNQLPRGGIRIHPSSWNSYAGTSKGSATTFSSLQQFISVDIPAEWLTIIKFPHPYLRGDGSSPTMAASRWIDAATMVDQSRADFYRDGPNGKMLLTADGIDDPDKLAELEDRLSRRLGQEGPRVTIVGNGAQIATKRDAAEMGYTEAHDQLRDATLAVHGVSRAMTGAQQDMTYGSLAAALLGTTMLAVQPDMDLIADEETVSIGSEYGEGICIEYEVPAINDPELEDRRLAQDASLGVMTVGEYRMKRGEPLFGTEYDNFILTGSGAQPPAELSKPSMPGVNLSPEMPSSVSVPPTPMSGGEVEKGLRLSPAGVIVVDDTLLESLDKNVVNAFVDFGYDLVPMMQNDKRKPKAVWDWSQGTDWRSVVKSLPVSLDLSRLIQSLEEAEPRERKYACVMLELPKEISEAILVDGSEIPEDCLASGGRESEPHVTLLYGIAGAGIEEIINVVSRLESPMLKFGWLDAFDESKDGYPVHVTVESDDLLGINRKLRSLLPHVLTHDDYRPHATVAYVNDPEPYRAARCRVSNKSCYASKAVIQMPDGQRAVVPLRKPYIQDEIPPAPKDDATDNKLTQVAASFRQ
jgi:2'-5' RNA ligase